MVDHKTDKLSSDITEYLQRKRGTKGGLTEAACGLRHKTLPRIIGSTQSLTFLGVSALLLRLSMFLGTASLPVLVRKLIAPSKAQAADNAHPYLGPSVAGNNIEHAYKLLESLDIVDLTLIGLIAFLTGMPKLMDAMAKARETSVDRTPHSDLDAAIRFMPSLVAEHSGTGRTEALRHCLTALKLEISHLIGERAHDSVTEVTLLQFCPPDGSTMQVVARTTTEATHRPCESRKFFAYHTAMTGRWFAEHDFQDKENPCPKTRLTVLGSEAVNYRSVLYLPIFTSKEEVGPGLPGGQHGATKLVVDYCIGVICVHSPKPYRFWRWGDHRKVATSSSQTGMGDFAYKRSLPYISFITRLIEHDATRVQLGVM